MDARKEAGKLQTRIAQLGVATVVRDQENKLHVIPGCEVEVIGCYGDGIKRADLVEDIEFSGENFQAPATPTARNRPDSGGK
mgnify:CR=1 FL=1